MSRFFHWLRRLCVVVQKVCLPLSERVRLVVEILPGYRKILYGCPHSKSGGLCNSQSDRLNLSVWQSAVWKSLNFFFLLIKIDRGMLTVRMPASTVYLVVQTVSLPI